MKKKNFQSECSSVSPVRQETSNDQAKMVRYEKLAKYLKAKDTSATSSDPHQHQPPLYTSLD